MDWSNLVERAELTPADVKERLDLTAALEEVGGLVFTAIDGSGRRHARCPFHDDNDPSLDVWVDQDTGQQRWGCHPCGVNGDVFDFIQRVRGCRFPEAFAEAASLLDAGLVRRTGDLKAREPVDLNAVWGEAISAYRLGHLRQLLADRDIPVNAEWLAKEFQVAATDDGAVLVPHLRDPGDGRGLEVMAIKKRLPPTWSPPLALSGSKLLDLYGAWRLTHDHDRVIVCEGESDTWAVAWWLQDEKRTCVLGLPSGAAARVRPEWLTALGDREVLLCLDADEAGRRGLRRWAEARSDAWALLLPDGEDACSAGRTAFMTALADRVPLTQPLAPGLDEMGRVYARPGKDDNPPTPISSFTLRLVETVRLEDEEELVLRVRIPAGQVVELSAGDLSDQRFRAWCNRRGLTWTGTAKDVQALWDLLQRETPFVPRLIGTRVAGFHQGAFVFPDLTLGPRSHTYVPPVADVGLASKLTLVSEPYDRAVVPLLARLHLPEVTTPILGWIAAAPLRALFDRFPVLAVTGASGLGKTTLVQAMLDAFGYHVDAVLTSTTPHAVSSFAGATNGIPVWFDEYRPGARSETLLRFEQTMRDAWTGQASVKGGLQDNRQALTSLPATAPLVVTGEDELTETSHLERSVYVRLPREGRSPQVLAAVEAAETRGLGLAYLRWLLAQYEDGTLLALPDEKDRQAHGLAVARWGYELLTGFARDHGLDLPDFVEPEATDVLAPELEALREALHVEDRSGNWLVWTDEDDVLVRTMALVKWVKNETDLTLPGKTRAVRSALMGRFPGGEDERSAYGLALRLPGAAKSLGL